MCGIAGLYIKNNYRTNYFERFIKIVKECHINRGPDSFNISRINENLIFCHNRLSIIDVTQANQPMSDEKGVITYNGEIYNYKDLKIKNENYKYHSDTEILLKGLNNNGINFVNKTSSMFAFGYYNNFSSILTIARDRIGIKPLYYIDNEEVFAFSSTITPLLLFSKKEFNYPKLWQYYQNRAFKAPATIFSDIMELEPGCFIEYDCNNNKIIKKEIYWTKDQLTENNETAIEIQDNIEKLLLLAVKDRLIADVPVAAFLSGGVDSGLIVGMAQKYYSNIDTFTVNIDDKRFSEARYAKNICDKYSLRYNEINVSANDLVNYIDKFIIAQDDIVADPSALFLMKMSEFCRDYGIRVMLSGEGSDELFGGYNSYKRFILVQKANLLMKHFNKVPEIVIKKLFKNSKKRFYIQSALSNPIFLGTALIFEPDLIKELMQSDDCSDLKYATSLKTALEMDITDRIPNDILTRTDRATMAASIEARVPFLSHQLVNYAATIPPQYFMKNGNSKYLVKKIAEKYIPLENIYRSKIGFDMPLGRWMRNELKEKLYDSIQNSAQKDYINIKVIKSLYDLHQKGKINASDKLWAFLCMELSYNFLMSIN